MTATINLNIDIPQNYSVSLLEHQLMEYAQRLVSVSQTASQTYVNAAPRKIKISSRIRRMSGRYPIPDGTDYRELRASDLEEKYNAQ